jgi:diguanylate cyclase (GGDEF)-like protein/PAS domain S-box-containing protein
MSDKDNAVEKWSRVMPSFILLGIAAWVLDSFVDTVFFYKASLPGQMFAPNLENIWSRLFILCIFIGFGAYAGSTVSRLKAAEKKSGQARQFADAVFNSMHDAISVLDADTYKIIDVNAAFLSIHGFEKEDVVGKTCYEVTHRLQEPCAPPHDPCPFRDTVRLGTYSVYEHEHFSSAGEKIFAEVSTHPVKDNSGKVVQVVHVSRNITKRKKIEAEIKKLSMVAEKTADMVVITGRDGTIEYVNPAFEALTGYSRAEAVGNTPRILKSGMHGARFYEELWDTILSGNIYRDVFINRKKNGDLYYDECTITPVTGRHGEITHFVATAKDITKQKHAEQELRERAERDHLTGVYNRRMFYEMLAAEVERAVRYERPLSLIMLDIDHFKKVNDLHGHAAGDEVLKATSLMLQKNIRHTDILARVGGEEFVILATETSVENTVDLAEKIRSTIEAAEMLQGGKITVSFGVAGLVNAITPDEFMRRADEALYQAKARGRNRVEQYPCDVCAGTQFNHTVSE